MTVKRYDPSDDLNMRVCDGGDYVRADDYDTLLSLNAELLEALEKCVDLIQLLCPIEGHDVRRANDIIAKARSQS